MGRAKGKKGKGAKKPSGDDRDDDDLKPAAREPARPKPKSSGPSEDNRCDGGWGKAAEGRKEGEEEEDPELIWAQKEASQPKYINKFTRDLAPEKAPPGPLTVPEKQDFEKSALHKRCMEWIADVSSRAGNDEDLANRFCEYGGFLTQEKAKLAERGAQQFRKSQVIASLYGSAMRSNDQAKMNKYRKQSEDNERAFDVTKLEVAVLNHHMTFYRKQKIHSQLEELGKTMAVKVGQKDYVMKPELDLPDCDFASFLEEEKAFMGGNVTFDADSDGRFMPGADEAGLLLKEHKRGFLL